MSPSTSFRRILTALLPLALLAPLAPVAEGQILRTTLHASGFSRPVNMVQPPGDTQRFFVSEQHTGAIRIIKNGVVLGPAYTTVAGLTTGNEQGLLGLAFHPNWASNGKFYYYATIGGTNIVRQITVSDPTADVASISSTVQVLAVANPFSNHNGGCLQFGPDGYLYISKGDGGSANDPNGNGQNINVWLGKLLRVDVDADDFPGDATRNYATPSTNPFDGATAGADEIWHYGLRNPWRFSFDRTTGDIYIGDVGQGAVEEVSFAPAGVGGLNFGWRCMEGGSCTGLSGCTCAAPTLTPPIQTYTHGSGISITGGYIYRGTTIAGLDGTYFYADYGSNTIWSLRYTTGGGVTNLTNRTSQLDPAGAPSISQITTFAEDNQGELYIVEQGGEIWKIGETAPGVGTCTGDGSLFIDCPCGNFGTAGRGCANSANANGAFLTAVGGTATDSVRLDASGMPAATTCIFLKGDGIDLNGIVFGDGLLCVVGSLIRLRTRIVSGGAGSFPDSTDTITLSARGGTAPGSGLTAYYQTYYRNAAAAFCPPETFNITNGYRITW